MTTYASARRDQYRADIDNANAYYSQTRDLSGFQTRQAQARDTWQADIVAHYRDEAVETELREALAQGGRVYATLNTGETVRVNSVANLYSVTDITGAPAEPIIARMSGGFTVSHATIADIISRA